MDISFFQKPQCCKSADRDSGGLFIRQIGRFYCNHPVFQVSFFCHAFILGISAKTKTGKCIDRVTFLILVYFAANRFNTTCQLKPEYGYSFRPQDTIVKSCSNRVCLSHAHVPCGYCCRMDFYQHLIVFLNRFGYLFELKNLRWSVSFEHHRFHPQSPDSGASFLQLRASCRCRGDNNIVFMVLASVLLLSKSAYRPAWHPVYPALLRQTTLQLLRLLPQGLF